MTTHLPWLGGNMGKYKTVAESEAEERARVAAAEAAALMVAAEKIAATLVDSNKLKADADDRRERRELWKTVILSLVVGLPAIIGSVGGGIAAVVGVLNHFQNNTLSHQMNSMKDELVQSVRKEATAAGVLQGKAEGKANKGKDSN